MAALRNVVVVGDSFSGDSSWKLEAIFGRMLQQWYWYGSDLI